MNGQSQEQPLGISSYRFITERFSYKITGLLGEGRYGKVYQGWDKQMRRHIAVKIIPLKILREIKPGMEQREIDMLQQLKHPSIIEFYGFHGGRKNRDGLFLFLQLCSGGNLSDYIVKHKPTEKESMRIFEQLIEGMIYINSKAIFHRDLKPDNLLLTETGDIRIADFGTAREIKRELFDTYRRCTPIYAAPQVFIYQIYRRSGCKYSEKCDVFSSGYILYQMLTGEQFTKGLNTQRQLSQFLYSMKQPNFIIEHPALTPRWITLLTKMLKFDSEQRPTFAQIKQEIRAFLPPSDICPIERPRPKNQQIYSADLVKQVQEHLLKEEKERNKLLRVLKIMQINQHTVSKVVPRVYGLLVVYLSLRQYCMLAQQDLYYLNIPQEKIFEKQPLGSLYSLMLGNDKKQLLLFVGEMAVRVNKAMEQIRFLMNRQIIPVIQQILKDESNDLQRRVLEDMKIDQDILKFRQGEHDNYGHYKAQLTRCVGNIYQTTSELQMLCKSDLCIYLVLLQEAISQQKWTILPEERKQRLGEVLQINKILNLSSRQLIVLITDWKTLY